MAAVYGVPMESIRKSVRDFAGVEHRIEFVAEKNGVAYYNDSKGTNPDAAIKGIQAMIRPAYLIGGGYDKQSSYKEWIESFEGRVKKQNSADLQMLCFLIHLRKRFLQPQGWRNPEMRYCSRRHAQAGACLRIMRNGAINSKRL